MPVEVGLEFTVSVGISPGHMVSPSQGTLKLFASAGDQYAAKKASVPPALTVLVEDALGSKSIGLLKK